MNDLVLLQGVAQMSLANTVQAAYNAGFRSAREERASLDASKENERTRQAWARVDELRDELAGFARYKSLLEAAQKKLSDIDEIIGESLSPAALAIREVLERKAE